MQSWQAASRANWRRAIKGWNPKKGGIHRDWSIPLGAGGTAAAMYPAKYSFDASATALTLSNCSADFIVYPVNATGGTSQPNIVGFNNLYSGTAGGTGICNRTSPVNDDGVSATTMWSYNITAAGGQVATSPALSLDGTKVAFVETASGTTAHFHVLAWKSGDGVTTIAQSLSVLGAQNIEKPVTISSFATLAPVAGSGTATDLALGSTTSDSDTLSSPFVDYNNDVAYIGNDNGTLYRVKDVFCTVNAACTPGPGPAPSLDGTWGTGGALTVCAAGKKLSGAVVDSVTGNIFVGCADGKLYGFDSTGTPLTPNPWVAVGDGSGTGGIVDPPMLDVTHGFVYAVAGTGATPNTASAVLVQAKTADLSAPVVATLGPGGVFNLHAPVFNDAYFSSTYSVVGSTSNWLIYEFAAAPNAGGCNPAANCTALYGVGFDSLYDLNTGASPITSPNIFPIPAYELSPSTEFRSGTEDRLFNSAIGNPTDNFVFFNITTTFPVGPPVGSTGLAVSIPVGGGAGGTSGIIVDNASADAQAASVYFSVLSTNQAMKLTQSALQ